jgi:hypothetical protein
MLESITKLALSLAIIGSSSIFAGSPNVQAQAPACTATSSAAIADKIANGHSWGKHSSEFVAGKVIAGLAMPKSPKVTTVTEFKAHIQSVMGSATNKALSSGRKAYWGAPTGTIVIYDPKNVDCGTAFRPTDGKPYYDRQN